MKDGNDFYLVKCGACNGIYNSYEEAYQVATEIVKRDSEIIGGPSEAIIMKLVNNNVNIPEVSFTIKETKTLRFG